MSARVSVFGLTVLLSVSASCEIPNGQPEGSPTRTMVQAFDTLPLYGCNREDEQFLDDLQHRIFNYFWNEVYPETGIAIDHTENREGKVAATGFELVAVCIGIRRGWVTYDEGYERVERILNAFWKDPDDPNDAYVDGQFGLFWHFVDGRTGRRRPVDCVAMCDSADFIAGALVVEQFFRGTPLEHLAHRLYDDVQWDRFILRDHEGKPGFLSFGWVPLHVSETYYDTDGLIFGMNGLVDNSLLIYAMALGSETHPIPQETWDVYLNDMVIGEYAGHECVNAGALFCRQVPHSFIRFSRKRDRKMDYFLDTVNALLADRAFNMQENGYPPELWGLTDCFGKDSYSHGAPPGPVANDGTVGTTAMVGALPHVPGLALAAMRYLREQFGDRVYGRYGFTSSVNLKNDFVSPLYVGIELGPMIMMIENFRTGMVWDLFMGSSCMKNFLRKAGVSGVVDDFELPPQAPPYAVWDVAGGRHVITAHAPQHGRRCMALETENQRVCITGRLTRNDLLDFHFGDTLSLWTRDLEVEACTLLLGGQHVPLELAKRGSGAKWKQTCFRIPPQPAGTEFSKVVLEAKVLGPDPALDNLTLEAEAVPDRPE